jgi:gamma-glutamyltranspeptidase
MKTAPHGQHAGAHRPAAMGQKGMVCSGHYLASLAGMRILLQGGNAVDAAIATAAALGMVEPHMSGPGGDGYLMTYRPGTSDEPGGIFCADGTGKAPSGAHRELFLDQGIPFKGIRSVSVPGLVAGWCMAHGRFGSLPLSQVFRPAGELATEGFPVGAKLAAALEVEAQAGSPLFEREDSRRIYAPEGRPLRSGEVLRNPGYAATLEAIAREGSDGFYRGPVARAILSLCEQGGGHFQEDDLTGHRAYWTDPISTSYRGDTVYEFPPPSSGHVLLQELNLVERFDLRQTGWNTAATIHLMVEAKKLAFADRERYVADPDSTEIPLSGMLSKRYAAERAMLIDPARASAATGAGEPGSPEETTCFCVADQWGNAVCQLQSIQSSFGSGLVAGETGILLNNRMTYWHLDAGHPNALRPGKRVRHTMNPVMVFDGPDLRLVLGTPGADSQVQTNLQVLSHILDFGLDPQEAVEAPRWRHTQDGMESEFPHRCEDRLLMEDRFPTAVRGALADLGHAVQVLGAWEAMGSEQVIQRDARTRALLGGSDPRRDGLALAW